MIDLGLEGKRAVVSGAGFIPGRAGHGRQTALRLAEQLQSTDVHVTLVKDGDHRLSRGEDIALILAAIAEFS